MLPFWPSVSTVSIHKSNGTDSGSSHRRRNICISLSRRLDPKIPTKNNITKKLTRLLKIWDWCRLIRNVPKLHTDPTQSLIFIGGHFQTQKNIVSLLEERLERLKEGLMHFKLGTRVTARQFLSLLGTMPAMIEVVKHCRLYMRPIQIYLMAFWKLNSRELEARIPVRDHLIPHLAWWKN